MQQGRDDVYRAHLELRGLNAAFFHSSSLRLRLRTVSRPLFAGMGARVSLRNSAGLGSARERPTASRSLRLRPAPQQEQYSEECTGKQTRGEILNSNIPT